MTTPIDTYTHRRPVTRAAAALLVAGLAFALGACAPAAEPESTSTEVAIPDTAAGLQAQWVLDEINADAVPDEADIDERFDPVMFTDLAVSDLQDVFSSLQAAKPWVATEYDGTETQARVRIESGPTPYEMTLSVTDEGRMDGLFFGMPQPDRTPAASWDDLRTELDEAPYDATLQVWTVGDDEPEILIGDDGLAPIASVVKLYVLGAVVDAVAAGSLTWETPLTIDASVRSLPSGELQDLPDGSTVTVLEAAQKMIAISDNTATDALILAVGRDAVLSALADMDHSDPSVNDPLPTTRELFWLWADPDLRAQWTPADAAGRADVLAAVPAGVPDLAAFDATTTVWQDDVDWFATPADIARAHAALQEKATTDAGEPVRGILSENPGAQFGDEWTYVGFKGGSSSGVLTGAWYLERDGADPAVVTVFARSDDPALLADPTPVFAIAQDAAALLAEGVGAFGSPS